MRAHARCVATTTRSVPWQPPSTTPSVGSSRTRGRRRASSGSLAGEPAQAVAGGLDLLAVVEDPGQVDARVERAGADQVGDPQQHRDAGLHVRGAAAVQPLARRAGTARCRRSARCRGARPARPAAAPPESVRASTTLPSRSTLSAGQPRSAASTGSARRASSPGHRLDVDQRGGQRGGVRGRGRARCSTLRDPCTRASVTAPRRYRGRRDDAAAWGYGLATTDRRPDRPGARHLVPRARRSATPPAGAAPDRRR